MVGPTNKSALSRARLLEAAGQAVVEGEGAFELQSVADAAGVSVGLIYARFGSKAGLATSIVEAFYDRLLESITLESFRDTPWHQRERERIRRLLLFLYRDPLSTIVFGRLAQDAEVQAVATRRWSELVGFGARSALQGQARGEISKDWDPHILSAIINGALRHGVEQALTLENPPSPEVLFNKIWGFIEGGMAYLAPENKQSGDKA